MMENPTMITDHSWSWRRASTAVFGALALLTGPAPPAGAEESLAKESQNPLSTVVSVPFESNTLFNVGPSEATANVLNVKPVYPLRIGEWNLVKWLFPK